MPVNQIINMLNRVSFLCCFVAAAFGSSAASVVAADGQQFKLTARASEIDDRTTEYPAIDFVFETKDGKPADTQHAQVDTRVRSRGKLVIWLMSHNQQLFDRLSGYGLHAIQVHYANRWFSKCCQQRPVGESCRGDLRLEAATGEDFSDEVAIAKPDGMMERAYQFVLHLQRENPEGDWGQFLTEDGLGLQWENVIVSGSSHGSTTASRFAKHVRVSRVVALCGPRDQHQTWQSLPSKTPANRVFAFSHTLDMGWVEDHYCRSWELMGLNEFGPIVDVDVSKPPYKRTRRLVTSFDVGGDANRAHSSVTPGKRSFKNEAGDYMHEDVWKYLYTYPVNKVGQPTPLDDGCDKVQKQ